MADSSGIIDLFKLDVGLDATHPDIVIETLYTSDKSKGVRPEQVRTRWKRVERIGRGTFGEVWLWHNEGSPPNVRAVKSISKGGGTNASSMPINYHRELEALIGLSRVCLLS